MTPSVNSTSTSGTSTSSSSSGTSSTDNQTMFLQLLIAQLENQDPMNPTDGTQFVTELAQFQQLQTSMNTGQDVSAIRQDLDQLVNPNSSTSQTQS
jgi:flagellar basal-body rod modification protein FlgD